MPASPTKIAGPAALLCALLFSMPHSASAAAFTLGNLLVTQNEIVHEYTLAGDLVQSIAVPHPDTDRYDVADVVYDNFGRIHVFNNAPFDNSYISTYDPQTSLWSHTLAPIFLGNVSDGDLSIRGNQIFHRNLRLDLLSGVIDTFNPGLVVGTAETSAGHDGLLYSINSGSPRFEVQRTDPDTLTSVGPNFDLLDSTGTRLNGRGLAITTTGHIYAADWDGRIYHYDEDANYLNEFITGAGNLLDLDLRADGILATGERFGDVVITDTDFSFSTSFNVGSGLAYVGFVTRPIPEPGRISLLALGAASVVLRRHRAAPRRIL